MQVQYLCVSWLSSVGLWVFEGEYVSFTTSWTGQEGADIYGAQTFFPPDLEIQVNSRSIQERSAPSWYNKLC